MDIKQLLEQLIGQLDEDRAELFLNQIEDLDEDASIDEVVAVFESTNALDEEQIDELKKETLGKYIKKALSNYGAERSTAGSLALGSEYRKEALKAARKRDKGIKTATDKLVKGQYQESEELSSETYKEFEKANAAGGSYPGAESKHKAMANKLRGGHDDNAETELEGEGYQKYMSGKSGKLEDFAARLNAKAKQRVKDPQAIVKEDVEQLDELKKSTIGNYIDKAEDDLMIRSKTVDPDDKLSMRDRIRKDRKIGERDRGLDHAYDRWEKMKKNKTDESFDFSSDLAAIFEGQEFSEEFKEKAAFILETAVKAQFSEVVEAYEEALLESVSEMIIDEVEIIQERLEKQLETYIEYIAEEYMTENQLAITQGLQVEIAESIMEGIKDVLIENNISVPEEKVDLFNEAIKEQEKLLESAANEKDELETLYNKEVEKVLSLREELESVKRQIIAEDLTSDLTLNDKEKLINLFEEIESEDAEEFMRKASLIKETYHKPTVKRSAKLISEDFDDEIVDRIELAPDVEKALDALDRFTNK